MPNDFSCIRNCVISESGVISKGVVNPMSVTRLFYECSEDDEEMEPITEPWRAVIANSVRKCEVELPKEIAPDDYNFYYSRFVEVKIEIQLETFPLKYRFLVRSQGKLLELPRLQCRRQVPEDEANDDELQVIER